MVQTSALYPRKKLIAPRRRRERACKRTDAASGTFCGKEERRNARGMTFHWNGVPSDMQSATTRRRSLRGLYRLPPFTFKAPLCKGIPLIGEMSA